MGPGGLPYQPGQLLKLCLARVSPTSTQHSNVVETLAVNSLVYTKVLTRVQLTSQSEPKFQYTGLSQPRLQSGLGAFTLEAYPG